MPSMMLKNSTRLDANSCFHNSIRYWAINLLDVQYRDWLAAEYNAELLSDHSAFIFTDPQQLMLFKLRFSDSIDYPT